MNFLGKKLATHNPTRTRTKFDNNKCPPKSNVFQKQVSIIERYLLMINTYFVHFVQQMFVITKPNNSGKKYLSLPNIEPKRYFSTKNICYRLNPATYFLIKIILYWAFSNPPLLFKVHACSQKIFFVTMLTDNKFRLKNKPCNTSRFSRP